MNRWLTFVIFIIGAGFLAACEGGVANSINPSTATAVAYRIYTRSTDIAWEHNTSDPLGPQATATAQARLVDLADAMQWTLTLSDTFDLVETVNEWPIGESEDDLAYGDWTIQLGKYHWDVSAYDGLVWWSRPAMDEQTDFYFAVDVQQVIGPANSQIGIVFRQPSDEEYYFFNIRQTGEYALHIRTSAGWETLISDTPSSAIRPAMVNRLAVIALDARFTFFINGLYVADFDDNAYRAGDVGLAIGLEQNGDSAVFEFDNFELRLPVNLRQPLDP